MDLRPKSYVEYLALSPEEQAAIRADDDRWLAVRGWDDTKAQIVCHDDWNAYFVDDDVWIHATASNE
jgi:hypothetical protein